MDPNELNELADKLAPLIAPRLIQISVVFGPRERVSLGKGVVMNNALFNVWSGQIIVEDNVFCGHNVLLVTGTHDITKKNLERFKAVPQGRNIIIREGVFIGSNVTILAPCEIGAHSVIGAHSLVMSDIPPNCLYAGSPARFIKEIDFP